MPPPSPLDPSSRSSVLSEVLARIGRDLDGAREHGAGVPAEPETLYDRHGVLVIRVGDVVVKAAQPDRDDEPGLARRLRAAAGLPGVLLAPLAPLRRTAGRLITVWPYGRPVSADDPPWEEGARLLARLHGTPANRDVPAFGRPTRTARTVGRLPADSPLDSAVAEVRRAFATLPGRIRGEHGERNGHAGRDDGRGDPTDARRRPAVLIHGDWHLGQLVRLADGTWRLIDVEDLGLGDPAWDLARPAALYSAGVLPADDWARFLGAYRAAGGPAVPGEGDPWGPLDVPARTLAIQIAATCVLSAHAERRSLDEFEAALVDTCARISQSRP